jgi:hypothetical protein
LITAKSLPARALVLVEHGDEKILALLGADFRRPAAFHDDACIAHGVSLVNAALVEKYNALRTRKKFALNEQNDF